MSFNSPVNPDPKKLPGLPGLPGLPKKPNEVNSGSPAVQALPNLPNRPTLEPSAPSNPGLPPRPVATPTPHPAPAQFQQPAQQPVYTPTTPEQPVYQPNQYEQPQQTFQSASPQQYPEQNVTFAAPEENTQPKRTLRNNKNKQRETVKTNTKKNQYTGRRRNVIFARVAVFGLAGILMLAGIFSFLPKSSGLTASDKPLIISAVRENLNYTDFPRASGEGFALAFATTYLNYSPETQKERYKALQSYVSDDVLTEIEPRQASPDELALAQESIATTPAPVEDPNAVDTPATGVTAPTNIQNVTEGPYLVGSLMYKGGSAALFTVMAEVNNSNWVYMQVPMYYNESTGGLSVSGSVTFSPTIPTTTVPEWEQSSSWSEFDREVGTAIQSDIASYIKAWTASDTTNIERYLVKENGKVTATPNAVEGLSGQLVYVGISDLNVQAKPALTDESTAQERADFNTRQVSVVIKFLEPSSGLVYEQNYRLVIQYVNQDWFVQDINNVSTQLDRDAIIKKEQESATKSE